MSEFIGFWKTIQLVTWEHVRETGVLTGYTILGGLTPLWMGPFFFRWAGQPYSLATFAEHGEFALYGAAVIAPALYLLGGSRRIASLPARDVLLLLSIVCLVFAIAAYAPSAVLLLASSQSGSFDADYYSKCTLALFVACVTLFIIVTLLDNVRRLPPVQEMTEDEYTDFEKGFDNLA